MPGVTITVNDAELSEGFARLISSLQDPTPALKTIGDSGLTFIQGYFDDEAAPDGDPWESLKPATIARKQAKGKSTRILRQDEDLLGSIVYQVTSGREVVWGTNRIYANVHQFGWDERGILARPFLGFEGEAIDEFREILRDFLGEAWGS